ncbi:hypothetical protein JW930_00245 [Candidatus Woesearchaeota archaeon]|nr:hypothetical protein [Candidatus Woesearchaeota archaeon]
MTDDEATKKLTEEEVAKLEYDFERIAIEELRKKSDLIELNDKIIYLRFPQKIIIQNLICEALETDYQSGEQNHKGNLYKFSFGKGLDELILFSDHVFSLGETNIFLEPMSEAEIIFSKVVVNAIYKHYKGVETKLRIKNFKFFIVDFLKDLETKENKKQISLKQKLEAIHEVIYYFNDYCKTSSLDPLTDLRQLHIINPFLFKEASPIMPFSEDEFRGLSREELISIIELHLTQGFSNDPRLIEDAKRSIFLIDQHQSDNYKYAKYQDNKIIVEDTKTAKTSIYSNFCLVTEDFSKAGLTGYSTSDTTAEGVLTNEKRACLFDEMSDNKRTEILSGALNLMEKGIATIIKGKQKVVSKYANEYNFTSNPAQSEDTEAGAIFQFSDLIKTLTNNPIGFGSRIGTVRFMPGYSKYSGKPIDSRKSQKIRALFEHLRSKLSQALIKAYENTQVLDWLEEPYSIEELKQFNLLIDTIGYLPVKRFFESFRSNYARVRGGALKQALLLQIDLINRGELDFNLLLEDANKCYSELFNENLKSIRRVSTAVKEKLTDDLIKSTLEFYSPKYARTLIKTLILFIIENKVGLHKIVLEELKPVYEKYKDYLPYKENKDNYFSDLIKDFHRANEKGINNNLRVSLINAFGVDIEQSGSSILFKIKDTELFNQYLQWGQIGYFGYTSISENSEKMAKNTNRGL